MSPSDDTREAARTRCLWLRTKSMYLNPPAKDAPAPAHSDPGWWCLKTSEGFGPDGHLCSAPSCSRPGRPCYDGPPVL